MLNSQIASPHSATATAPERPVSGLEYALLFLVLMVFSEGILPRLVSSEEVAEGSPFLRYLWLPIYGVVFLGLVWKAGEIARVCLRLPFLMALLAICAFSFLWSIDPGLTQRRSLAIIMTSAAGLYLGTRYSWQTLLRVLGGLWLVVGLASFVTALLLPEFGRAQDIHAGAWKGLYYEKNQLGGHMARAAVFSAFLWIMDRRFKTLWAGAFLLSVVMVLLTTSKTALLGLLLGLGILAVGAWMKRGVRTSLVTLWAGVVCAALVTSLFVLAPGLVFELLGRDASLTGRTDIWVTLIGYIEERPLLGYGYGAFWAVDSEPGNWVREVLQWDAPTAHNGWLEVAIALGLVGLAFLTLDFLMTLVRALLASLDTWTGLFALAFCAQFFLFSLSESASLQQNSIVWLIYVALAAKLTQRPKGLFAVKRAWASREPAAPAPYPAPSRSV
ncbi:MAG: O-antigen ligase [Pseudomonadota bacterium]